MKKVAYLAIDVHARNCVLGHMDFDGTFLGNKRFPTSERHIMQALKAVKAKEKYLALEESNLAYWVAQVARAYVTEVISSDPRENALIYRSANKRDKVDTHKLCRLLRLGELNRVYHPEDSNLAYWVAQVARPYVTEVISSDPRENALIYRSANKRDKVDTHKLCRLLRLGELNRVYHPEDDHRAIFKAAVQHYIDLRDQQVVLKNKIKAMYRHWGVIDLAGQAVYGTARDDYLQRVKHSHIRNQLHRLYCLMDETKSMQKRALKTMKQLGRKYPEIKQFEKIPGIGEILSHIFDAFIKTPHRFANKRKLWRYCRLGVTDRSSDGKPLGFKRLDKSGVSELKALSYRAWLCAMAGDNEVRRFYSRSLRQTSDHVHARLNTQRKIVAVIYGMWKRGDVYRPELFLDSPKMSVV